MLDQNTDRMWYVIGAVIIGAALILIMNKTFPQLFASVGETFQDKTEDVMKDVEDLTITDGVGPMRRNLVYSGEVTRQNEVVKNTGIWYMVDANALKTVIGKEIKVTFEARNPEGSGGYVDGVFTTPQDRAISSGTATKSFALTTEWVEYSQVVTFNQVTYDAFATTDGTGKFSVRSNSFTPGNTKAYPSEVRNVMVQRN